MFAVLFVVPYMLPSSHSAPFLFLFAVRICYMSANSAASSLLRVRRGAGGEVRLSAIWIPSNCSSGFSLNPSPNLYFLSGRPIFHRLANNAVLPLSLFGEGVGG